MMQKEGKGGGDGRKEDTARYSPPSTFFLDCDAKLEWR